MTELGAKREWGEGFDGAVVEVIKVRTFTHSFILAFIHVHELL